MTIEELTEYYGNAYRFEKATKMTRQSFHNWVKWGRIPVQSQLLIEKITKGKLKAEWES